MQKVQPSDPVAIRLPARGHAPQPQPVQYNAALDTFSPSTSPQEYAAGQSLVRRFVYGVTDWCFKKNET